MSDVVIDAETGEILSASQTALAHFSAIKREIMLITELGEHKVFQDKLQALESYARNQGATHPALCDIADLKLLNQRQAGKLLAEIPRQPGKRSDLTSCDNHMGLTYVEQIGIAGIDAQPAHRWQKSATVLTDHEWQTYLEDARTSGEDEPTSIGLYRLAQTKQRVGATVFSSASAEYYTPAEYIDAVREVMGAIDLDPASCQEAQETIRATEYFTMDNDGLSMEWYGRVFLNPPYGKVGTESAQGHWAEYLMQEYGLGHVSEAILLVKAALGYNWFEALWDEWPVCFVRQRLSFGRPGKPEGGQSKQGTALFYLGKNIPRFVAVFAEFGRVILIKDQL